MYIWYTSNNSEVHVVKIRKTIHSISSYLFIGITVWCDLNKYLRLNLQCIIKLTRYWMGRFTNLYQHMFWNDLHILTLSCSTRLLRSSAFTGWLHTIITCWPALISNMMPLYHTCCLYTTPAASIPHLLPIQNTNTASVSNPSPPSLTRNVITLLSHVTQYYYK